MTDSYRMSDMCAMCGERYGQHVGLSCCNSRGSFFLAAKPANGPESYHYRDSLDDYFTRAAEQANRLVFPSGAAVLTSGDKIVGRVGAKLVTTGGNSYSPSMGGSVTVYCVGGGGGGGGSGSPIQRAPLPNSDEWRGIGHKDHDTFGADFIVTKGAEPTSPLYDSPTTDSAYPAIAGLLRG